MNAVDVSSDSRLRFDLAVQKSRVFVYSAGYATALIGRALGVFPLRLDVAIVVWVLAAPGSSGIWPARPRPPSLPDTARRSW